jgi:hypothetical protein
VGSDCGSGLNENVRDGPAVRLNDRDVAVRISNQLTSILKKNDSVAEQTPPLLGVARYYSGQCVVFRIRIWTRGLVLAHGKFLSLRDRRS